MLINIFQKELKQVIAKLKVDSVQVNNDVTWYSSTNTEALADLKRACLDFLEIPLIQSISLEE